MRFPRPALDTPLVKRTILKLSKIDATENDADLMTKYNDVATFERHRDALGFRPNGRSRGGGDRFEAPGRQR